MEITTDAEHSEFCKNIHLIAVKVNAHAIQKYPQYCVMMKTLAKHNKQAILMKPMRKYYTLKLNI